MVARTKTSHPSTKHSRAPRQLSLLDRVRTRGGKRPGAGRKRAPGRPKCVEHRRRPEHARRHPVHVTLRAHRHVPSFRRDAVRALIRDLIEKMTARGQLNVAHFSIQHDHLHLLVESDDKGTLSAGLRSFIITFALRLNALLGRRNRHGRPFGKVWADRYHRTDLTSPTQTRHTLAYVLNNYRKHFARVSCRGTVDFMSSAPYFDGWSRPTIGPRIRALDAEEVATHQTPPWPRFITRTWLLGTGWKRAGGLLDPEERPGPRR